MNAPSTIHASAVLIGAKAMLIRGPAGSGKSRLAYDLVEAGRRGALPFTRLVADDRAHIEAQGERVVVRPAAALAGLIEVRGLGIRRLAHEPLAVLAWVVDLAAADAERHPAAASWTATLEGVTLPRLAVAPGISAVTLVLAWVTTGKGDD